MSSSCNIKDNSQAMNSVDKILLMGNPNVGKSIFFSELTGIRAISSNYAGTTVIFMEGQFLVGNKEYTLIDVPGTYSLSPTSEAEAVAADFMERGAQAVICVLDASNLERNLRLALEIKQYNIPIIYTLNLIDVAKRHGININIGLLSQELGAPIIPTIAVKKQGFGELKKTLESVLYLVKGSTREPCVHCSSHPSKRQIESSVLYRIQRNACTSCEDDSACPSLYKIENNCIWAEAKRIARRVIKKDASSLSFIDKLGENMMKPMPGLPIAVLVMGLFTGVVVGGGEALQGVLLLPLVNGLIVPFFRMIFTAIIPEGVFLNILVGEYGIFVISFEWILALIFPYVLLFYITFSLLEDSGYLPRISVLFDNIMRKLGMQGGSLIHIIMGFGCAVPAIMGSRAATSRKERIVICAAICFAIPCISQTGALLSLLSAYAWWLMPVMALFGAALFITATLIAGKLIKGKVDPLLIEIPNLLVPEPKAYFRKLILRMKHFLLEAEVPMLIAIVIAALLKETGLLAAIAVYAQPLVSHWLGLPDEAVIGLILGVIRREMSVVPLLALNLSSLQAFIGGAVSLMYLPCIAVFATLVKEFKLIIASVITLSTIFIALFIGGLINQIAQIFL